MKHQNTVEEFISAVSTVIEKDDLNEITPMLVTVDPEFYQPIMNLFVLGYSISFVFANYVNFYRFAEKLNFDYNTAAKIFFEISTGFEYKISIQPLKSFSLN